MADLFQPKAIDLLGPTLQLQQVKQQQEEFKALQDYRKQSVVQNKFQTILGLAATQPEQAASLFNSDPDLIQMNKGNPVKFIGKSEGYNHFETDNEGNVIGINPQGESKQFGKIGKQKDLNEFETFMRGYAQQNPNATGTEIVSEFEKVKAVPKTSIEVQSFVPANVEAQKEFMKEVRDNFSRLKDAPAQLENLERTKALVPKAASLMGPFSKTKLEATKFFRSIGIPINTEGVQSAEELQTRLFQNIMDNLKKLDAQPSQLQQQIMMESLGKLGTDPAALPKVLDAFGDAIRDRVAIHNEMVDSASPDIRWPIDPHIKLKMPKTSSGNDEKTRLKQKYGLE